MKAFDGLKVLTTFFSLFPPCLSPCSLPLCVCVCHVCSLSGCHHHCHLLPLSPSSSSLTTTTNSSSSCKLSIFLTAMDLQCPSPLTLQDFSLLESRPSAAVPASWRCLVL